ncbi:MAG: peptidylprolyl isomerase [Desulfovibrionaceae bacterium]|nr:peptidylprolyl isomerase [Desulfovibrionaceae bacterium]
MRKCIALVFLLALALCTCAEAAQYGKIAAVVNGKPITMYDLQREASGEIIRSRLNLNNPKDKEKVDVILRRTLDNMILDILIQQEAKRLKVTISDEDVDQEITRMYTSRKMTRQQFEQSLAREKIKLSDLRENYRKGMTRSRIMAMEVARRVVIRPEEIRDYYEKNKETMLNRQGLHMALIVYHPQAPAASVARQVRSGDLSWLEASRRYSVMPGREKGGDTGPVQWDSLNDEWRGRLMKMQPGDVTPLFQYNPQLKAQVRLFRPNGDNSPLRVMTLDEAKPEIENILRAPRAQERFEEYTNGLKRKAVIDIRI